MLPLFPYSRQSDIPYNKTGAPLAKVPGTRSRTGTYSFESRPQTPHPGQPESAGLGANGTEKLARKRLDLIVANDVTAGGAGFQHDTNAVSILSSAGTRQDVALTDKRTVAMAVLDAVLALRSTP